VKQREDVVKTTGLFGGFAAEMELVTLSVKAWNHVVVVEGEVEVERTLK